MKTINDRWKEFEEKVIPKNACPEQRIESKRFFCGFAVFEELANKVH